MNCAWKNGVSTTLECTALDMVRVDTPGFVRYIAEHCECRPPLRDCVQSELESFKLLFIECLANFKIRSEAESREIGRLNSSANSGSNLDRWKEGSRNQLCVGEIEYLDPRYFLDYYQSDIVWKEEEGFDETNTSCSEGSMIAYFSRHCIGPR